MAIVQRLIVTTLSSPRKPYKKPLNRFQSALLVGTVGLSLGVTACTPADTATAPGTQLETQTDTEATVAEEATKETADSTPKVYVKDGVAIGGADPVAYFTEETFVPGSTDYAYEWQGVSWQFASAKNRDLFTSNPEQYAPQYGGHCAWAVAAKNALVPIDPEAWSVVDGKLYLNANKKVQKNWEKDIPGFIAQADSKWPALAVQ